MKKENLTNLLTTLFLLLSPLLAIALDQPYYVDLISRVIIIAIAAVGLNLALGYGGMVSFGHAAAFGIGGYISGVAAYHAFNGSYLIGTIPGTNSMLSIWACVLIVSAIISFLIGIISLRTKGVYFIMITLAFAQMIYYFAISFPKYGGEDGLPIHTRNTFFFLDTESPIIFFAICFILLLLSLLLTKVIMGSRFGAALTMAKLNEVRLETAGIEPLPIKLIAFVISGMITAIAGALFADLNGFVGPSMLSWHRSGELMVIIILGGVGRLFGPILGAIAFVMLETVVGGFTERWQFFLGLTLLAVVMFGKGGIIGLVAGERQNV